jgi:SAM-dependent methyltransferase
MRTLQSIAVPDRLQRNAPDILEKGIEETGEVLLNLLARRISRDHLAGLDLLDIGCGVRFTQTLINRDLPFSSYTGIEVSRPIVDWLKENVEKYDDRFHFVHWNVRNSMYNKQAPEVDAQVTFPVDCDYDVVMGFSLVTHLGPSDAAHIFQLARKAVRPRGFLFFSAFCDDAIDEFEDRVPGKPLLQAYYNKSYLQELVRRAGWTIISVEAPNAYMMDSFLCKPRQ